MHLHPIVRGWFSHCGLAFAMLLACCLTAGAAEPIRVEVYMHYLPAYQR